MHRKAMQTTEPSNIPSTASSSSHAFYSTFGAPNLYVSKGVHDRAITPVYGSHQRLSSLESTLAGLQLWTQSSQRPVPPQKFGNQTKNNIPPLQIGTQLGTTRFDGSIKPISNNTNHLGTTNILRNNNLDSYAKKAYTWTPSSLISPIDTSVAIAQGIEKGLLLNVPEPHAILRPRADRATYTSRSSAQGITSRAYTSNIDHTLTALIVSRGENGVMALPSIRNNNNNNNNNNSNRSSLNPSPTNPNASNDETVSFDDNFSPIVGHNTNNNINNNDNQPIGNETNTQANMDIIDEMQGTPMDGDTSLGSISSIANNRTMHIGGNTWTTRKSYSLARMENGPELLRSAAMQARFTYRMGPRHNTDLTHNFIENGTWNTMNFRGDTHSPTRRTLKPLPLGNNLEGKEDVEIANDTPQPSSPGFVPSSTSNNNDNPTNTTTNNNNPSLPPVVTQTTALGKLLQERFIETNNQYNNNINTIRTNALLSTMPLKSSQGKYTEEMIALNNFDDAHDMGNPTHWPKKVLRIKIAQSGIAHLIGMDNNTLEKADKAALLAAYERIPSTKRMLELYNQRNRQSQAGTNQNTNNTTIMEEEEEEEEIISNNTNNSSGSRPSSQGRRRSSSRPSSRGRRSTSNSSSNSRQGSASRTNNRSRPASSNKTHNQSS